MRCHGDWVLKPQELTLPQFTRDPRWLWTGNQQRAAVGKPLVWGGLLKRTLRSGPPCPQGERRRVTAISWRAQEVKGATTAPGVSGLQRCRQLSPPSCPKAKVSGQVGPQRLRDRWLCTQAWVLPRPSPVTHPLVQSGTCSSGARSGLRSRGLSARVPASHAQTHSAHSGSGTLQAPSPPRGQLDAWPC